MSEVFAILTYILVNAGLAGGGGGDRMSTTAIAFMVLVCGLVWGGFALLLVRAVRSEGRKR